MANFTIKSAAHGPISHPIDGVNLRAEKVTEQAERWFLEFKIKNLPIEVTNLLEFTTEELDKLFLAYEMIKPIVKNADNIAPGGMTVD